MSEFAKFISYIFSPEDSEQNTDRMPGVTDLRIEFKIDSFLELVKTVFWIITAILFSLAVSCL